MALRKNLSPNLVMPSLSQEHLELLKRILRGPEFLSMAKGNAEEAKTMRENFGKVIGDLVKNLK